jgi:hypothetical protein
MPQVTGTVLLVQESRLRLLGEDGRGHLFLLAPDAPVEPQDLPPLTGLRIRLSYRAAPGLTARVITDLGILS